ncbi:MAG: hypothetical protein ACP5QU_01145 [Anaerolineae bacterium]
MNHPTLFDIVLLLVTGLTAAYLLWCFFSRWQKEKGTYDIYYMLGFLVLLVAGVLLIFLGYGILGTPFVLTVSSLIPLGISMGIAEQFYPTWKKAFKWFALVGILAIAVTSFGQMETLRKIVVPLFHSVAGLVIFLGPFFAKNAAKGFWWVGIGGALIGIGGIALAFLTVGKPLLGIFTAELVFNILSPLLLLMTLAFTFGFVKDIRK